MFTVVVARCSDNDQALGFLSFFADSLMAEHVAETCVNSLETAWSCTAEKHVAVSSAYVCRCIECCLIAKRHRRIREQISRGNSRKFHHPDSEDCMSLRCVGKCLQCFGIRNDMQILHSHV